MLRSIFWTIYSSLILYTFLDYFNPNFFFLDRFSKIKKFSSLYSKFNNFHSLVGKYYNSEILDWHCYILRETCLHCNFFYWEERKLDELLMTIGILWQFDKRISDKALDFVSTDLDNSLFYKEFIGIIKNYQYSLFCNIIWQRRVHFVVVQFHIGIFFSVQDFFNTF